MHDDIVFLSARSGWVETAQHGLQFGFDVTRVMFSSGNVTERKRMGHIGSTAGSSGLSGLPAQDLQEVNWSIWFLLREHRQLFFCRPGCCRSLCWNRLLHHSIAEASTKMSQTLCM